MKSSKEVIKKPSRDSLPWAFWHWNLTLSQQALLDQLDWFATQGFGGVAIRPSREMVPGYLSQEFFTLFESVLERAQEKHMAIRLADDFSLPLSGMFSAEMAANQKMRSMRLKLVENRLLSDRNLFIKENSHRGACLTVALKEMDGVLDPASAVDGEGNGADFCSGLPESGTWRVLLFQKEFTEIPGCGYLPNTLYQSTAQRYTSDVLDTFVKRFASFIPSVLEGFITELPPVQPNSASLPWDDDLVVKFRNKTKKNIIRQLPALFCDNFPQAAKNRHQVIAFLHESLFERFVAPLEEWAGKNKMSQWVVTAEHSVPQASGECIDGFVPAADTCSAAGFSTIDGSIRTHVLQRMIADTNANQYQRQTIMIIGRNRTGTATTLQTLKSEVDRMLFAGPGKFLVDGFFTNLDQRSYLKSPVGPGWYAPEGKLVEKLCSYIARSNDVLSKVHWSRQVAVLFPVDEIMASFAQAPEQAPTHLLERIDKIIAVLEGNGYGYDFVSETLLTSCTIKNNGEFSTADRLRKGNYQALVIPHTPSIGRNTLAFVEKLVQKEGYVLFVDASPLGTIEDGISSSTTSRIEKVLSERYKTSGLFDAEALDEGLENIPPVLKITHTGKYGSEIVTAAGTKDGVDVYLLHNTSEVKDQSVGIAFPDHKHFAFVNGETGEYRTAVPFEKAEGLAHFQFALPQKAFVVLMGSASAIPQVSTAAPSAVRNVSVQERSYRILLKDQWQFSAASLNAYPLSTWNVRIGLSRESGGFSHYYESSFQVKNPPTVCRLAISDPGLFPNVRGNSAELPIEITINGIRIEKRLFSGHLSAEQAGPVPAGFDSTLLEAQNPFVMVYSISELLVRGSNRISIRTTDLVSHPRTVRIPPMLFGDFLVVKGQSGGVIDTLTEVEAQNSWVKSGFPCLLGTGIYRQSFELPDKYEKLMLSFPHVSGAINASMNGKPLGICAWQPMCFDITAACADQRNELEVRVMNTIDSVLRMNGKPSGILGDVYLDVF